MLRLILCLCLCVAGVLTDRKLPSYVNVCKRTDPEISKCWQKTLLDLRPYLAKGIPEFDVDPISKFHIEKIHLDQSTTKELQFDANLLNLTLVGGENFDVPYTTADFSNFSAITINVGITFPKVSMTGHYKATGQVLQFPVQGEGELEGKFGDVQVNGTWHFKLVKKGGQDYMQIDKDIMDVQMGTIFMYLHDLFKNNPEITKKVNNAINRNMDVLYEDFKPLLQTTMAALLDQYLSRVFSLYTFDVLLPAE